MIAILTIICHKVFVTPLSVNWNQNSSSETTAQR